MEICCRLTLVSPARRICVNLNALRQAFKKVLWRREFGGLKSDHVKRMKELEAENARLRRAVADLTLHKLILKEAASGNW